MPHFERQTMQALCQIVSPVGMLGYGIDARQTDAALEHFAATGVPTALILDSGSTDGGPQKLALGGMTVPKGSYVRDLRKLLASANRYNVPLIISSAGGSGTNVNTLELAQVVKDLADEIGTGGRNLKVVSLLADIPKETVKDRLRAGDISGCGIVVPPLTEDDIDACPVIAAQMGPEPFVDALNQHPDLAVLVGGRAYDPAPFIAFAEHCYQKLDVGVKQDRDALIGGFTHVGKILECAGLCAIPKGGGAISTIYIDGSFDVSPMAPTAICTPLSIAAHTLYEKSRPDKLYGPGGYLDLTKAMYTQLDDQRTVRVSGGRFFFSTEDPEAGKYQIKLEGAKAVGYRAMYVGAIKDPILIGQIDRFLENIRAFVAGQHEDVSETWDLQWHVYGRGSSISSEPEICIVGEALAATQELATSIAATAKVGTIHGPYENQKATSGNLAHGIGGVYTVPLGPCAEFCVYHLMNLQPGEERAGALFRIEDFTVESQNGREIKSAQSEEPSQATKKESEATKPQQNGHTNNRQQNGNTNNRQQNGNTEKVQLKPRELALSQSPILGDIAQVIRSKNSGPYEITFDVMFAREEVYVAVKNSGILDVNTVANLFRIKPEQVIWSGFFDQACAYKATIPRIRGGRLVAAGGFMEDDVHGSQVYMPLLNLPIPERLVSALLSILAKSPKA
ncbi:hypothetical protein G7046_g5133 [Stylonectria norvegica]|nr:hypothetical protein G7046_g5133 [Stylonectria norvegica]